MSDSEFIRFTLTALLFGGIGYYFGWLHGMIMAKKQLKEHK